MLTQEDKDWILELRAQGYSYQKIHEITGFSISTIMKVCREAKEKKLKELKEEKSKKIKESKPQTIVVPFSSAIDEAREISNAMDCLVKSEKLKGEELRVWSRRNEDMKKFIRVEVDDRITGERAEAVAIRDEEWRRHLEDNYVHKDVVTGFENTITNFRNTIQKKDVEINNLKIDIKVKDDIISEKDSEIVKIKENHDLTIGRIDDNVRGMMLEENNLEEVLANYKKLMRKLLEGETIDRKLLEDFNIDI
jgi:hypothetical protein